jgi:cysteine desulfurase
MRDRMQNAAESAGARIWGKGEARLPGTLSFSAPGFSSQTQLMAMDLAGIAISSGSACSSGKTKPSHVLAAMGAGDDLASCGVRVSIGWNTRETDIDAFCAAWPAAYARVKERAA